MERPAESDDATWNRVKAVFLQAIDREGDDRQRFLAAACGDDAELRREVESLLASDAEAGGFCEIPAAALVGELPLSGSPPRLAPGARLAAYEISEFIGAGGMGEVYRARDTRLNRDVALKTIGVQHHDGAARLRLLKEARHASALRHPNICTIHEIGEAGGLPYIVMEYVNGQPLSHALRNGALPLDRTLSYAIQVAGAVEHAHARGIAHRDLKSSNVVVDDAGRAIVLDFGLARRLPAAGGQTTESTAGHPVAGTLSHMAPEVLRGERADARSDIWALGVLLHEMAAGTLPFAGRTAFETSSAILSETPVRVARQVPLPLRLVILRCLAKGPEARYQRAADVRAALEAIEARRTWPLIARLLVSERRLRAQIAAAVIVAAGVLAIPAAILRQTPARGPGSIATLAVLPLESAGGSQDHYYVEGLTEALIAELGAMSEVRVMSRASAARVATTGKPPADVARELRADAVIQGTLYQSSERIRIDLRLIDAGRGRVLWTEGYERSPRDVLVLQADVVRGLAVGVRLALRAGASDRLAAVRSVRPEVYEEYLKGRYHWNHRTDRSLDLAIEHFTRAVDLDATYAPAHAALADCYNQLATVLVGRGSPREFRSRAAAAALKALQIDPLSAEAHAALGYVRHYQWQWTEAERGFQRAIALNPSLPLARVWYANLLMSRARFDEAIEQVLAARDLDPFSLVINTNVGWVLHFAGRTEDAIAELTRTIELDPDYPQARWRLAGALDATGRHDEALEQAKRGAQLMHGSPMAISLLASHSARAGRVDEARRLLRELLDLSDRQYVSPNMLAGIYAVLGDTAGVAAWLERAFEEQSNVIAYLAVEPTYAPLRHEPFFQSLLRRAGLP